MSVDYEKIFSEYMEPHALDGGATILDSLMHFVGRFVCVNEAQARVVVLWIAHTHALDAADCTAYLNVNSAEKQSGKTRLLEVSAVLVARPWLTGRVTAAVLTRKIDAEQPTLLLDESDTAFASEKEYAEALRGILNTGYRRSGRASLCVGQGANIGYKDFSTFSPKCIAGIGKLPDTVADRSIPIRLKRARRGVVEKFREREAEHEASLLYENVSAWAKASLDALKNARPEIPAALSDRQSDVCEPLLAIADAAGNDWAGAARTALLKLCAQAEAGDDSIGVQLLRDVRIIFSQRQIDEISSTDLADSLAKIETSPWGEWNKGNSISAAKLARLLKPFEVFPSQIREHSARGYRLEDFQEPFSLYLPLESVQVSKTRENTGDLTNLKVSRESPLDTSENAVSASKNAASGHLDTLDPGGRGEGANNGDRARPATYSPAFEQGGYVLDPEGPGCVCEECHGHYGTLAGWKAHKSRNRCL